MINKIIKKKKIILGIETSFDNTSSAILKGNKVLSNIIYTQNHKKYKGIVPNIASNLHLIKILNIVKKSIIIAKIKLKEINGIAFTRGPGLINSLIIGENFAKSLSLTLKKKIFGINHIQAHIFSHYLYNKKKKYPNFPFLCLSISGGHTKIFKVNNFFKIKILGETLDNTLGELFDKISIYLGLDYLKGPDIIEKYSKYGIYKYIFPIPKVNNLNFSFSGLNTFIFNFIKNNKKRYIKKNIYNICRSLHETIFIILKKKINKAIKKTKIKTITITGGVSCNKVLIKKFSKYFNKKKKKFFFIKNKNYLKDNGAMIALLGQIKNYYKLYDNLKIKSNPNLGLENINI
ncbi:MAG: tRNA (adenosine(37)-N6)-threonylcarbamoyltransferase complex transferase subunit TsaD [Candidatus Shikimatogenerans bostrichidophilus]|nr:MAG: tRNA (adenosine(37)-N6)-threonylcarbamoyltransferase complex transferase subunit TsaD [Candidatus Shikimatogenerans bostrichidophilus]